MCQIGGRGQTIPRHSEKGVEERGISWIEERENTRHGEGGANYPCKLCKAKGNEKGRFDGKDEEMI